jgi:ABC-type amino acid transport substrate-binding protein
MTYSAPSDISNLIGTTYEFNMTVSEVEGVYQTIKVHFLDDTDYTNYHLLSNESNFRDAVNFALQKAVKDGYYAKSYKKWFGANPKVIPEVWP